MLGEMSKTQFWEKFASVMDNADVWKKLFIFHPTEEEIVNALDPFITKYSDSQPCRYGAANALADFLDIIINTAQEDITKGQIVSAMEVVINEADGIMYALQDQNQVRNRLASLITYYQEADAWDLGHIIAHLLTDCINDAGDRDPVSAVIAEMTQLCDCAQYIIKQVEALAA